jgi:hypothetical protein
LMQVESQNQKFNADKPLPIQHYCSPYRSWESSLDADIYHRIKVNATKLLPIQDFWSPGWSSENSLGAYNATETKSMQANHYQFSISEPLTVLKMQPIQHFCSPGWSWEGSLDADRYHRIKNQCKQAITNSAFLQP